MRGRTSGRVQPLGPTKILAEAAESDKTRRKKPRAVQLFALSRCPANPDAARRPWPELFLTGAGRSAGDHGAAGDEFIDAAG